MTSKSPAKPTVADEASSPVQSKRPTPKHEFEGHGSSRSHFACRCDNGTILIRKAESGEVKVGPIKDCVCGLAYSPLGDRIATGGQNQTICIWDSKTGKLVDAIENLDQSERLMWLSDGTKLYSASDKFARVFDSVLACMGIRQLWDTETHQQLGQPFGQENTLHSTIEDAAPEEEETRPKSPSSSCLNLDAKNPRAEGSDDPYKNFFRSPKTSLALPSSDSNSRPFSRRFWTVPTGSRHRLLETKKTPFHRKNATSAVSSTVVLPPQPSNKLKPH